MNSRWWNRTKAKKWIGWKWIVWCWTCWEWHYKAATGSTTANKRSRQGIWSNVGYIEWWAGWFACIHSLMMIIDVTMIELCSSYWWWSRNAKQDVVWIGGFSREYDRSHFKAVEEVSEDSEDYQRRSIMYSIDFDIDNYWIGRCDFEFVFEVIIMVLLLLVICLYW